MPEFMQQQAPQSEMQAQADICPQCGAPVLPGAAVCDACGALTGAAPVDAAAQPYPTVQCRLAKFTFFGTLFPLIFAIAFGIPAAALVLTALFVNSPAPLALRLMPLPFLLVSLGAMGFLLRNVIAVLRNESKGRILPGLVCGYEDDNVTYNGRRGQKVRLLVQSQEGSRYVLVPLGAPEQPYAVGSTVHVRLWQNTACIMDPAVNW